MTIKLSQNKREAPDFWAPLQGGLPRRGWGVLLSMKNNPSGPSGHLPFQGRRINQSFPYYSHRLSSIGLYNLNQLDSHDDKCSSG